MAEQKLGKYVVQERLGRGGMAEVYKAYHANLDRYVAIKVLHAFLADDDEFRVRFEKEARNIAKLNHPNIVQVYDFDYAQDRDSYYMVMELIEGETLKDRLYDLSQRNERLPLPEVLRIIREAASALAFAHSRGMIHRDVKPANLMMDTSNRVVLTDFGIAKMLDNKQMTVSGGMIGTPAYMSPEQGLGEPGDERSDIYSLGIIMYQLLVGELPYDAETALGVILMHVNDPIPELRTYDSSIPDSVQRIVQKAMAKDPDARYQSAEEVIADIEACERTLSTGEATRTRSPLRTEPPAPKIESALTPPPATLRQSAPTSTVETTGRYRSARELKEQLVEPPSTPWGAIIGGLLLLLVMGYAGGAWFGFVPDFGVRAALVGGTTDPTPTLTATDAPTETEAPTATAEPPTAVAVVVASETLVSTETPAPSVTPTLLPTATILPTETLPPTQTATPSPTPNMTQTVAVAQTATIEACIFDYAVVEQVPSDGEAGGFFRVGQPYVREITLLNTGTCDWGENTSLTFVSGEDFDAGPRIFIRDSLKIGDEMTLRFEGVTPNRGSLTPFSGIWQLRTRGQVPIGDALQISVLVFDPGS